MTAVLVTGMSATGKSTALAELARRGHRVVDTDDDGWIEDVPQHDGAGCEPLWREDRIDALLAGHADGALFVSGCVANQGRFYPRFDAVVLLKLGRALRRFIADFLRFVVQLAFGHAINLVRALAVKSTMGTTRA